MESIFLSVINKLGAEMPELSMIDEDCGQLEMSVQDDQYPLTFPCVLVNEGETLWSDVGTSYQKGDASITVKLAIDCYDDTHYTSGTVDKIRDRLALARKLYKTLQGFKCAASTTRLTRVRSGAYTVPGCFKVYEITFAVKLADSR